MDMLYVVGVAVGESIRVDAHVRLGYSVFVQKASAYVTF